MFSDVSAWFSSSVDNQTRQLWKDQGGDESDFDSADFIFSAANNCPDTLRVFTSTAYIIEHLEVFHSRYISDCVKAGDRSNVILGHYILPPQDILNDVRKHTTLAWDIQDLQNQPPGPNSRNVTVGSLCQREQTERRRGPLTPSCHSHSRHDKSRRRPDTAPGSQPVPATPPHTAAPPSCAQGQRSGDSSRRPDARRPPQGTDRASASTVNPRPAVGRASHRQARNHRGSAGQQQKQSPASAVRADLTAGQKRAAQGASTSARSPTKQRNTERNTAHTECVVDSSSVRQTQPPAVGPGTKGRVQTSASDQRSVHSLGDHHRKESTQPSNARGRETPASRTPPGLQRVSQRRDGSGGRRGVEGCCDGG
ncbi:hypothetical protein ACOMHN_016721 [Nucella lapillus]